MPGINFHIPRMSKERINSVPRPLRFQAWKQIILFIMLVIAISFLYEGYKRTRRAALENYSAQQEIYAKQVINAVEFRFGLIRNVLNLWGTSLDISTISERTPETMQKILAAHSSYISSVTRMDENGIIRFTFPVYQGAVGADISYQEHIQELLDQHTPVTSDAFMTVQGYWAIAFHVPCFDSSGNFTGSLALLVPFREMFQELFQQLLPEEEIVPLVMDSDGLILFSPVSDQEGKFYSDVFAGDRGMLDLADSALAGVEGYILSGHSSIFQDDRVAGRMVSSIVPFSLGDKNWILILSMPEEVVMRNIADLSNRWLIGMGAIVLLALLYTTLKLRVFITSKEEEKWENVARLKDILIRTVDQAREVIIILDSSERIIYANRAAKSLTGYDPRNRVKRLEEVDFIRFQPTIQVIRKTVIQRGGWTGRITGMIENQHPFKMDVTASAVKDSGGAISNFIIIGRDVTAQVEMEKRLAEQQKMEAIGQLAGGVAHDFNNLLVGVLGYAELLKEHHSEGSQAARAADVIISAVHQASDLTRQLLGFARKGKHRVAHVDLAQCVRNVNTLLKRTMDRRISVLLDLQDDIFIRGDSTQIEQVILNLAVNARDAMPEGGQLRFILRTQDVDPEILGLAGDSEPLKLAVLRTEDTGCGIPQEHLEKIFEPFFTTKEEEGTGMGLATVYGIVINHGGWIDVSSKPGEGSVFTVYLPIDTTSPDGEEDDEITEESVTRVSGMTILVVDDEYMVVTTLMELLNELGYNVVTAPGGERAIELFSRDPKDFDAVIMDLSMPGMDGKECFEKLVELDPDVKVILATGFSRDGRVQELLDMGVMGFLQKPFRMKELAETLERIIVSKEKD